MSLTIALRKQRRRAKRYRLQLRSEVITRLGGECVCCGEKEICFLAVDHTKGGGTKERKKFQNNAEFYRHLRDLEHPETKYRVLCHNCNSAFGFYKQCPHQARVEETL